MRTANCQLRRRRRGVQDSRRKDAIGGGLRESPALGRAMACGGDGVLAPPRGPRWPIDHAARASLAEAPPARARSSLIGSSLLHTERPWSCVARLAGDEDKASNNSKTREAMAVHVQERRGAAPSFPWTSLGQSQHEQGSAAVQVLACVPVRAVDRSPSQVTARGGGACSCRRRRVNQRASEARATGRLGASARRYCKGAAAAAARSQAARTWEPAAGADGV